MTARAFAFVYAVLLGGAVLASGATFASSCTTETTPVGFTGYTGQPSVAIASPPSGSCVPVSAGSDAFVPVQLTLNQFVLRPPGGCVGLSNCGQVRLTVNGLPNNVAANYVVDVSFAGPIASHYGTLDIEVELIDDQGNPWIYPADAGAGGAPVSFDGPYTASVTITTAASCEGGS